MGRAARNQEAIDARARINLRLSRELLAAIDRARDARAGQVSRNTWIAEAITEKVKREERKSA